MVGEVSGEGAGPASPGERRVADVMRTQFVSVDKGENIDLVDRVMRLARIRHLPVFDDERVVGILSNRDLLVSSLSKVLKFGDAERRALLRAVDVSEVMTRDPVTIRPDASLTEAARELVTRRIGCLLVQDAEGTAVGLLTETDLLRAAVEASGDATAAGSA
jgi:acetoin utilization protein AcuB